MMLGGVGYQVGLDEARRKQLEAQRRTVVAKQLKDLGELLADGHLTPEEFQTAKAKLLGS